MVKRSITFFRSKRGMSTVFGGLFFIMIMLSGFTLVLWSFAQLDAYQGFIIRGMEADQARLSERLEAGSPPAISLAPTHTSFNVSVNNKGGVEVSIVRVYIVNLDSPCTQYDSTCSWYVARLQNQSSTNCATCDISNYNIALGASSHLVKVTFIEDVRNTHYRITLVSERGNALSFTHQFP